MTVNPAPLLIQPLILLKRLGEPTRGLGQRVGRGPITC